MFRCFASVWGIVVLVGVGLIAAYLVLWHGQHLAALLPILLVFACPLTHMLMHRHGTPSAPRDREQPKKNANEGVGK